MKKIYLISIIVFLFAITSCTKDDQLNETKSILVTNETTEANSETTYTTINISGKIISNDGTEISSRGVCWSTEPNPTINDNLVNVENNVFTQTISNLTANTTYYFRVFVKTSNNIIYSDNQNFNTLSLNNTLWKFTTNYENNFQIDSNINFYENGTTKFDEIGVGQGYFITYGTWSLNGNSLTYIWEGNDSNTSAYTYTGTITGMTMYGTYSNQNSPNGTWTAILN